MSRPRQARYYATAKGQAANARYESTLKAKSRRARYEASDKGRVRAARYRATAKGWMRHRAPRLIACRAVAISQLGILKREEEELVRSFPV